LSIMKSSGFVAGLLLWAAMGGCASHVVSSDEALPVYHFSDVGLCRPPAGLAQLEASAGTRQLRALFLSSSTPEQTAATLDELPGHDELDAALYLSCVEFASGELSREALLQRLRLYQVLRLEHMQRGIARWLEEPEGYAAPGKLCHFIFNGDEPDARNLTRMVPAQTSADDCALHVFRLGGTHVLLGCGSGRWRAQWAKQPLLAGENGWVNRRYSPAGTRYVPEPNCGWS
jgi:hypothetical protein